MPHFLNIFKVRPKLNFAVSEGKPATKAIASLQITRNPRNPLHAQPCVISLENIDKADSDSALCAIVFFDRGGNIISVTQVTK